MAGAAKRGFTKRRGSTKIVIVLKSQVPAQGGSCQATSHDFSRKLSVKVFAGTLPKERELGKPHLQCNFIKPTE